MVDDSIGYGENAEPKLHRAKENYLINSSRLA
jgi:hypothetical protein